MVSSLARIDASEPVENILSAIERDGGVIVTNLLSKELLEESMRAIEPSFSERGIYDSKGSHGELGADFFPEGSQRVYGLLSKMTDPLIKIVRLPVWQQVMGHFLNDEFTSFTGQNRLAQKSGYILASTAALRLVPGAQPQPLHRVRPDPNNPLFTPMMGCLIAGSKCTYKNGATVIPGSHLWGVDRAPNLEEVTYAEMEPGSALFTLGSTYHGAGENRCGKDDPNALRTLFAVFGQRDYYRQDQEEVLSTPLEIARKLPEDILRLAGYYKSVGGVGFVEDHQHPVEFLQNGENGGIGRFGISAGKVAVWSDDTMNLC
ncbi:hypothetical protein E4T43_08544 [Aureobasidium subglaciale]|nr:hypothetical protein E4T43_08544 [Aureobasidium subglaciale]